MVTQEHWDLVLGRMMPIYVRDAQQANAANCKIEVDRLAAFQTTLIEKSTTFHAKPTQANRNEVLAAQAEVKTQETVLRGCQEQRDKLGEVVGQLDLMRENWERLCPECATRAGLPPLAEHVEAEEIARLEAGIADQEARIALAKIELEARKG